jgi:two-component system, sensor histidine kinase and response regulator
MASLVSFNRMVAMDRVGGDENLLREIAGLFLEEYPGLVREMEAAISTGDPDRLQRAAHTLKGSLGTLGAEKAFPIALDLEMKARHRQMDGLGASLENLRSCMLVLHEELTHIAGN